MSRTRIAVLAAVSVVFGTAVAAQDVLNLYSSRHYDTDEQLYTEFETQTGITINRIEGKADELIARMMAEGANSPADILLTVDTSRLARAKSAGLLQPIESAVLETRIPDYLQDVDNEWFGFSKRSRIIFFDKTEVNDPPQTYEALADPKYKGLVCIRSSSNAYNQTLLASMIAHDGAEAARDWAAGVVANMARRPQGGDTDQLRGLVSGECDIAVANTYYFARAIRREVKGVSGHRDMIGWSFPNQDGRGAHMNLSGAGVARYAPHSENAIKFLEYLAGDGAQTYFSAGNDEFPAVDGVPLADSVAALGAFKADTVSLSEVAANIPEAQMIFNEVGWK